MSVQIFTTIDFVVNIIFTIELVVKVLLYTVDICPHQQPLSCSTAHTYAT